MEIENHIDEVRTKLLAAFSEQDLLPDYSEEFVSPNGKFRIRQKVYRQAVKDLNWLVSKIEVHDEYDEIIASFMIDNDNFFHHWLFVEDNEYLLYAENLCGGNSILNLKTRENQSYSDGTDGFIFCRYFPSPHLRYIAVGGCIWGSPYFLQVFNTTHIDSLPWPMICEIDFNGAEEADVIWINEYTIRIFRNENGNKVVSRDMKLNE